MWVKVVKSGLINWFANGKTSGTKKFYTKTEGAVVPPKVWTHVAGTFDGAKGIVVVSLIKLHQNSFHSIVYSKFCLLYTSPSPRDGLLSRMPSSA